MVATRIENYEVDKTRLEVRPLCPNAELHGKVSEEYASFAVGLLTIESQEPVQRERASLLTPKQLTRLSWPCNVPTLSPRRVSQT